jgi:hypothetical protein
VPEALTSLVDGISAVVGTVKDPVKSPVLVAVAVATVRVEDELTL